MDTPATTVQAHELSPQKTDGETATVQHVIEQPGTTLDSTVRNEMEARFDADFSDVQIHTGPRADESTRALDAKAYTVGTDIVVSTDAYEPDSVRGKWLLAHELAHVCQQTGTGIRIQRMRIDEYRRQVRNAYVGSDPLVDAQFDALAHSTQQRLASLEVIAHPRYLSHLVERGLTDAQIRNLVSSMRTDQSTQHGSSQREATAGTTSDQHSLAAGETATTEGVSGCGHSVTALESDAARLLASGLSRTATTGSTQLDYGSQLLLSELPPFTYEQLLALRSGGQPQISILPPDPNARPTQVQSRPRIQLSVLPTHGSTAATGGLQRFRHVPYSQSSPQTGSGSGTNQSNPPIADELRTQMQTAGWDPSSIQQFGPAIDAAPGSVADKKRIIADFTLQVSTYSSGNLRYDDGLGPALLAALFERQFSYEQVRRMRDALRKKPINHETLAKRMTKHGSNLDNDTLISIVATENRLQPICHQLQAQRNNTSH